MVSTASNTVMMRVFWFTIVIYEYFTQLSHLMNKTHEKDCDGV